MLHLKLIIRQFPIRLRDALRKTKAAAILCRMRGSEIVKTSNSHKAVHISAHLSSFIAAPFLRP